MVSELHVWGPAFGLPSIDAECIAVIAYLQRIVPHGEWKLVAGHDTSIGPQGRFPLLIDGKAKVTGFSSIIAYLQNQRPEAYDLDRNLSPQQKTDSTAFATFLESSATPLIDLSLYVSAENYNGLTSSAYTAILPWYMNYTIPPRRRDLARSRTVQLGLSSLDVDSTSEEGLGPGRGTASAEFEAVKRAAGLPTDGPPKVLSMGRGKGIGGLLGSPVYAARVKLDALSNEVLEPLSDLLTKQDYLFGSSLSSLDCLAFGYLSLMFYPAVPQAWLKETIQNKFPDIAKYTQNLRETLIGNDETNPSDIWSICSGRSVTIDTKATVHGSRLRLPWGPGMSNPQFGIAIRELTSGIPLLQRAVVVQPSSSKSLKQVRSSLPSPLVVNSILGVTATIAVGLASVAVHHRRSPRDGDLIFWALRPTTGFGEAGNILTVLANQLPNDAFSRF